MAQRIRPVVPARRAATAAAGLLLALGLAACGGGSDEPAAAESATSASVEGPASSAPNTAAPAAPSGAEPESEAVTVTAVDFELQVDEDSFTAGAVEFTFVNDGGSTHDLVVERDDQEVAVADAVDPGQTSTVTVTLEPGEYVLYCSIANHRAMGMETTIEVS